MILFQHCQIDMKHESVKWELSYPVDNNGWDWLGGIALILGIIAIYNNIRR